MKYINDVNGILQSKAYCRYVDKTQVVYLVDHDHITKRHLHVQMVSRLSREVGEELGLNLDLIEAIALGHDVGHPPFGHEGEEYLSDLSVLHGNGPFSHPWQSCRLFSIIEPLDLKLEVYDGFLCHDGGLVSPIYQPHFGKSRMDHERELREKKDNPDVHHWPMTVEGCVVKLCDTVSYVARDLEDAIVLKLIERDEIPDTPLGKTGKEVLDLLRAEIVKVGKGKKYIGLSDSLYEHFKALRAFNFQKIYFHPALKRESKKVKQAYRLLFDTLLLGYREEPMRSPLYLDFLKTKEERYIKSSTDVQLVVDYLAGMTNSYFLKQLGRLVIPSKMDWEL